MADRSAWFTRLAGLLSRGDAADLANRSCAACRSMVAADGAAISVTDAATRRATLSTTDSVMARLQDVQDLVGEGPCLDAARSGTYRTLEIGRQVAPCWPEFVRAAWDAVGEVTLHSFPMRSARRTFGVVSVYLTGTRPLSEPVEQVQLMTDVIGSILLRDPLAAVGSAATYDVVSKACGMVAAQLGVAAEDALAILRAHAYAVNTTLKTVAHGVLERQIDFRHCR